VIRESRHEDHPPRYTNFHEMGRYVKSGGCCFGSNSNYLSFVFVSFNFNHLSHISNDINECNKHKKTYSALD
jgi:hypothetical protein